jgi:hypothetical protein
MKRDPVLWPSTLPQQDRSSASLPAAALETIDPSLAFPTEMSLDKQRASRPQPPDLRTPPPRATPRAARTPIQRVDPPPTQPLLTRDTKLALVSCAFGVAIGVFSMWAVGVPRGDVPTLLLSAPRSPLEPSPAPTTEEESSAPDTKGRESTPAAGLTSAGFVAQQPSVVVAVNTLSIAPKASIPPSASQSRRVDASAIPSKQRSVVAARPSQPVQRSTEGASSRSSAGASSFRGTLALDSSPPGARVSIDGKAVGTTPVTVNGIAAGSRVVRIAADGYQPWSSAVRVVANQSTRVAAKLYPVLAR